MFCGCFVVEKKSLKNGCDWLVFVSPAGRISLHLAGDLQIYLLLSLFVCLVFCIPSQTAHACVYLCVFTSHISYWMTQPSPLPLYFSISSSLQRTQNTHKTPPSTQSRTLMGQKCSGSGHAVRTNPIWPLRCKNESYECVTSGAHQTCEQHRSREDITHPSVAKAGAMTCPPLTFKLLSILGAHSALIH